MLSTGSSTTTRVLCGRSATALQTTIRWTQFSVHPKSSTSSPAAAPRRNAQKSTLASNISSISNNSDEDSESSTSPAQPPQSSNNSSNGSGAGGSYHRQFYSPDGDVPTRRGTTATTAATQEVVRFPASSSHTTTSWLLDEATTPVLLNAREHAVGYLSKILNARVYDAAIETELQEAKNLSAVRCVDWTCCCSASLVLLALWTPWEIPSISTLTLASPFLLFWTNIWLSS